MKSFSPASNKFNFSWVFGLSVKKALNGKVRMCEINSHNKNTPSFMFASRNVKFPLTDTHCIVAQSHHKTTTVSSQGRRCISHSLRGRP